MFYFEYNTHEKRYDIVGEYACMYTDKIEYAIKTVHYLNGGTTTAVTDILSWINLGFIGIVKE